MNSQENSASEFIANSINPKDVVLVNVKPHQLTKGNLILLKALGDINKKRGLIITLEKPHHYLTYLLGIQGISQRNLTYIDLALSKVKKIKFPIEISKENREIIGGFIKNDYINLENFDFIMIDNISTTKMYLTKKTVIEFLQYILKESLSKELTLILPMDLSREKDFIEALKGTPVKIIDFEEVFKNVN